MATEKIPDFNQYIKNLKLKQTNNQKPLILGQVKPIGDMRDPKIRSEINKKISEGAKNLTPNNAKNIPLKEAAQKCTNFCRSEGVFILPLRYTVIRTNAPALPATLGSDVKDVAISHFKYGVEMIDTGYIYRLLKRKSGKTEWAGYKVTAKGFLSYFVVGKPAPVTVSEFACKSAGHNFNASMIVIEDNPSDKAQTAYIIHTHVPLSPNKIKEYEKNAEAYAKDGKWQKFDVTSWAGGNTMQTHCLNGSQLNSINNYMGSFGSGRVAAFNKNFKEIPKKYAAMALYDPIGITTKLNNLRNSEFKPVMDFLAKKEGQFSNEHRLHSSQCIDSIKICLENRLITERIVLNNDAVKSAVLMTGMNDLPSRIDDGMMEWELQKIWDRRSPEEKARITKEITGKMSSEKGIFSKKIGDMAKNEGIVIWNQKYAPNLDLAAKKTFDQRVDTLTKQCLGGARALAEDHIKWLTSAQVLKALNAYDDKVQVPFGNIFHVNVMDMMDGMSGVPSGQALLETWLGVEKIAKTNIYMRAICYNQESLKNKYEAAAPSIIDITWDDTQGAAKVVISAFIAADKAWQDWAKQAGNDAYKVLGKQFSILKSFYWMSELTQSAIKWSMKYKPGTEIAKKLGRLTFYTFAHSGALAESVAKNALYYPVNTAALRGKVKLTPDIIQSNWKQYSSVTTNPSSAAKQIDRIIKSAEPSAGLRVSGVVAIFELVNFGTQVSKFNDDPSVDNGLVYFSGMMATTAAILEVGSGAMEKYSFAERAAVIAKYGAYFAIAGASVSFMIDAKNFKKSIEESNPYAIVLNLGKASASLATVIIGIGAFLNLPIIQNTALYNTARKYAFGRLLLAVNVIKSMAYLSVIGIVLLSLEIYLRNYVLDNAMQDWCQKCAFRIASKSAETPFKTVDEEDKEFNKAVVSV
nr:T6SS effector BTH_I2691 family protein [Acinetobacter sp. Marseille-Q1620]